MEGNIMKKVLSVTLASAMAVVTLAGCGGGNSAQQTKTAETAADTEGVPIKY